MIRWIFIVGVVGSMATLLFLMWRVVDDRNPSTDRGDVVETWTVTVGPEPVFVDIPTGCHMTKAPWDKLNIERSGTKSDSDYEYLSTKDGRTIQVTLRTYDLDGFECQLR